MAEIRELTLDPKYDNYTYPITNPATGTGHPGHTTPEQDALVVRMREELVNEGHTERLDTINLVRCHFYMPSPQPVTVADGVFSSDFSEPGNSMYHWPSKCTARARPGERFLKWTKL